MEDGRAVAPPNSTVYPSTTGPRIRSPFPLRHRSCRNRPRSSRPFPRCLPANSISDSPDVVDSPTTAPIECCWRNHQSLFDAHYQDGCGIDQTYQGRSVLSHRTRAGRRIPPRSTRTHVGLWEHLRGRSMGQGRQSICRLVRTMPPHFAGNRS